MVWKNKKKNPFLRSLQRNLSVGGSSVAASSRQTTDDEHVVKQQQHQHQHQQQQQQQGKVEKGNQKQRKPVKQQTQQRQQQQQHSLQASSLLVSSTDDEDDDDDDTKKNKQDDKKKKMPAAVAKVKRFSSFLQRQHAPSTLPRSTAPPPTTKIYYNDDESDGLAGVEMSFSMSTTTTPREEEHHHGTRTTSTSRDDDNYNNDSEHDDEVEDTQGLKKSACQDSRSNNGLRDPPPPSSCKTMLPTRTTTATGESYFAKERSTQEQDTSVVIKDKYAFVSENTIFKREKASTGGAAISTLTDVITVDAQKDKTTTLFDKNNNKNNFMYEMESLCGSLSFHDDVLLEMTDSMLLCEEEAEKDVYASSHLHRQAAAAESGVPSDSTRNVSSSKKEAATANNTSAINNKDLHFVAFDCSCQAPEVDLSQVNLQQLHNLPQVTNGVASSFDAATYFPEVILARSLVVGDINVVLLFECDYVQNCTQLYKQLEQEDWQGVDEFLVTGIWPDSFSKDPLSPSKQVRTWVTRFDQHNATKCHWSVLPLHLAIILGAPKSTIEHLVTLFPLALRCADDKQMLPLDLALRRGSSEEVIEYLCTAFPDANHSNKGGSDSLSHSELVASGNASDEQVLGKIHAKSPSSSLPPSQNLQATNDNEVSLVKVVSKLASASMDEFRIMSSAGKSYMGSLATASEDYVSRFASTVASTLALSSTNNDQH